MKETDLINLIEDYLTAKNIFHYRQNSGALKTERGGFVRFGVSGSPDFVCVIKGQYVGVEAKVGKNKLSENQMTFAENLVDAGGKYIVARDNLEDLIKELN